MINRLLLLAALGVTWVHAGCLPAEDPLPSRWSYLHTAVIQPSCATASCHSTLGGLAGIDLSDREGAYTMLTARICGEPPSPLDAPRNYVTPFSSESSTLMYQLRGADERGRPYRDVMPPDVPLPVIEIDAVAAWIDRGAPCD